MRVKGKAIKFFCIFMLLLVSGTGVNAQQSTSAKELVENVGIVGKINWTNGYVEVVGIGVPPERFSGKPQAKPMAKRAAQLDGYRKLLELIKGVRVDSTTTVKNYAVESDVIKTEVEGVVRGAQIIKTAYTPDGAVELTLRMVFAEGLSDLVYGKMVKTTADIPVSTVPHKPEPEKVNKVSSAQKPASPSTDVPSINTGVVIDARGLKARPAMSPKVIDEKGDELYGAMHVDREFAVQQGMSGYSRDINAAKNDPRVTDNPIVLKGIATDGPGKANIIIGNADAATIKVAADKSDFLKKCRVMIVLD